MKVISNYKTTLSASMTSSQLTVPVTDITTTDGHTITAADIDNFAYLVIEPGSANMEIVKVTGVTGSTWTGATRGLAFYGGVETSVPANQKAHQSGSTVILTNAHYYFNSLVDIVNNQTVGGLKTFSLTPIIPVSSPTLDTQVANKKYVDDVTISGGVNASSTLKGISKLTSDPSVPTNPIALNGEEVSATSGANKVVRAGADSKIDQGFLDLTENFTWTGTQNFDSATVSGITKFGGTGADGALAIASGTTTIDLGGAAFFEKNYSSISITGTGQLAFTNKHANGTIIVLKSKGNATITSSSVPAIEASAMGGNLGVSGNSVFSVTNPGTAAADSASSVGGVNYTFVTDGLFYRNIPLSCGAGGTSGGVGSGTHGVGGSGGGALMIEVGGNLSLSSSIYTKGANGTNGSGGGSTAHSHGGNGGSSNIANGGNGVWGSTSDYGNAGGGGGGGGSLILLIKGTITNTGTLSSSGGTGGTGYNNINGGAGANGYKYIGNAVIN